MDIHVYMYFHHVLLFIDIGYIADRCIVVEFGRLVCPLQSWNPIVMVLKQVIDTLLIPNMTCLFDISL